ncbi:membrane protein YqaA, SNARE-associated domain [Tistlia consotensis]|uniref:Membrane protein YqaA, SNARE-associated domain n=1 Tax=Tistlia consotensis USBA 355 TaxID=560819 RepID=A0A1Y6BCM0_9PROT|nr:YqaA family protein [Tistlia consotensis]SME97809.1 membrane protein YqaA, SNARE-associated domain [Tistlia consotensis USBA 355]SNR57173.1 membrane protein YqaA, SNARE-associated domain [Tistlia consotensis]
MSLLHRLYDWTLRQAGARHALPTLFGVAFIESSIFPIPPDVLILPMVLARRERAWIVALVATLGSVLGGLAGYAIGYFLYETVGRQILDFYGYSAQFKEFTAYYNEWGAWIVAGAGFTPFPFKVITIASGVTRLDVLVFLTASVLSRGGRFFLIAALLWRFGAPIKRFVEAYLPQLTFLFFLLLIGGFVALKYLF